ncbi:hypothetical protein [Halovenus sp. HT40]|uniref:hypothetical protein n=1 Tax=Halovenus sp. HT40 TaxID=3126691 RepID=UPI00300E93D6
MSNDDDTTAIALGGGLGSATGTVLAGVTSFTLGTLALAAGIGAAVGYGSYRLLRRRI